MADQDSPTIIMADSELQNADGGLLDEVKEEERQESVVKQLEQGQGLGSKPRRGRPKKGATFKVADHTQVVVGDEIKGPNETFDVIDPEVLASDVPVWLRHGWVTKV